MSRNIKAVIFDCDGVLVDSEKLSCGIFAEMMREKGANVTDTEVINMIKGSSFDYCIEYALNFIPNIKIDQFEEEYRIRSFKAFANEMKPVSGIEKVLNELRLPRAIVSNGPSSKILLNLRTTKLLKFFDKNNIFSGYDSQRFKPDPYLFIKAADKLGVAPRHCVVIEDSVHGAEAAQKAGMICYGYTEMTPVTHFLPYGAIPFEDMEKIRTIFAGLI